MMRKILFAAIVLFLNWCPNIYGQEITKEDYHKAVDYLNCKTVEFSLKLTPTKGVLGDFQKKSKCESYPDFNKIKNSIAQTEQGTINISEEINKIKTADFQPTDKSLIVKFLSNDIFSEQEKYPALYKFADQNSILVRDSKTNTDFVPIDRLKEQLRTELPALFSEQTVLPPNTPIPTPSPTTNPEPGFFATVLSGAYFLLPIIAILLCGWIYWDIKQDLKNIETNITRQRERLNKLEDKLGTQSVQSNVTTSKTIIKDVENKISVAMSEIKAEIESIKNKDEDKKFSNERFPKTQDYYNREPQKEIFYLPTPNEDGSFNESSARASYIDGTSIYKFTKLSQNMADFQINESDLSMQMALRYPETNIEPACRAQNSRSSDERRIVTLKPGKAALEGDRWEVKEKAVIKYEH